MLKIFIGLSFLTLSLVYVSSMMKEQPFVYSSDEPKTSTADDSGTEVLTSVPDDSLPDQTVIAPTISNLAPRVLDGDIAFEDLPKEDKLAAFLKSVLQEEVTMRNILDEENNYLDTERKEPYSEEQLIEPPDVHSGALNKSEYVAMDPELGAKLIADAEFVINDAAKNIKRSAQPDAVLDTDKIERELEEVFGFGSSPNTVSGQLPPPDLPEFLEDVLVD